MSQYLYLLSAYVMLLFISKLAKHFYKKHKLKAKTIIKTITTTKPKFSFWDQLVFHIQSFTKHFIKFP